MTMPSLDDIETALKAILLNPARLEANVVDAICEEFTELRFGFIREVTVAPGSRVDILVAGGIAVEVKKGKPNTRQVAAQLWRYAQSNRIKSIVLVSERGLSSHIVEANGKPVRYVSLVSNWGIAL